jgi:hypothetical protein
MPDSLLSRAYRVSEPKAAAAFSHPLRRRVILLLVRQERSLGELSSILGAELKRLHYHMNSLQALKLVVVTSQRARAGRPVKLYRAVADAFFVPATAATTSPSDALAKELRFAQAGLIDSSREGVLYHASDKDEPLMRYVKTQRTRGTETADCWRVLEMSTVEAQRLAAEMEACLMAAAERSRGATKSYLVHFAYAPRRGSHSNSRARVARSVRGANRQ